MEKLVQRLNDWWPFKDPIHFQLKKNIVLIVLNGDMVECIGIIRNLKVSLFGSPYNSIIRSHIIRVFAASIPPRDIHVEELFDTPKAYKSEPRPSTPITTHE
jgi:hypothetical protein